MQELIAATAGVVALPLIIAGIFMLAIMVIMMIPKNRRFDEYTCKCNACEDARLVT